MSQQILSLYTSAMGKDDNETTSDRALEIFFVVLRRLKSELHYIEFVENVESFFFLFELT